MYILSAKLKTKYPRQRSHIFKIYYVYISTRVRVGVHGGQKRVWDPGAEVISCCESPNMGAGNQSWILSTSRG